MQPEARWPGPRHVVLARPKARHGPVLSCPCRPGPRHQAVPGPSPQPVARPGHGTANKPARCAARSQGRPTAGGGGNGPRHAPRWPYISRPEPAPPAPEP